MVYGRGVATTVNARQEHREPATTINEPNAAIPAAAQASNSGDDVRQRDPFDKRVCGARFGSSSLANKPTPPDATPRAAGATEAPR